MISTNLTTVVLTPNPDNDNPVEILASTPSSTTVVVGEDGVVSLSTVTSPGVEVLAATPETVNISVVQEAAVVITTDPTSDTTVIVDENGVVTINTADSTPVEITTSPNEVVQLTPLEEVAVVLVTSAEQGPAGPPGPIGPAGGEQLYTAGQALSGHTAVRINTSGYVVPASCTDVTQLGTIVGVTTQAYENGTSANVASSGLLEHLGWTFAAGQKVFVGVDGSLVQSLPADARFIQPVGIMLSSTLMLINIEAPIVIA